MLLLALALFVLPAATQTDPPADAGVEVPDAGPGTGPDELRDDEAARAKARAGNGAAADEPTPTTPTPPGTPTTPPSPTGTGTATGTGTGTAEPERPEGSETPETDDEEADDDDEAVDPAGTVTHDDRVPPTPPPPPPTPAAPEKPWPRGSARVHHEAEPLDSWVLTTGLVAGGGATAGSLLALVPLFLPFPGSTFLVIALPLIGASVGGGVALHQASDSVLVGIVGGTLITGAVVVVAATTAIALDKVSSPWVPNGAATGAGWVAGSIGGAALAAGLITLALKPPENFQ